MKRREFLGLVGGASVAWPVLAQAQQSSRSRRVGVLMGSGTPSDPEMQSRVAIFEKAMQDHGWSVGRDIELQYRWPVGNSDLARNHARELVRMQPDVILAATNTAMAALHQEKSAVPTVFVMVSDPVAMGYVQSLARPGGNVTGFTPFEPSLGGKWLALLKEMAPNIEHIGVMFNPETGNNAHSFMQAIGDAASTFGIKSIVRPVRESAEIANIISALGREPNGALIFLPDALTAARRDTLIPLVAHHRLPAIYPLRFFATGGGLISYGIDSKQVYRQAASYVDRLLRGARVEDLPIQAPTNFELVINVKTARTLGLDVPATLLVRADEVIE